MAIQRKMIHCIVASSLAVMTFAVSAQTAPARGPATGTPPAAGTPPPVTGATSPVTGMTSPVTGITPPVTGVTPPVTGSTPAVTGSAPAVTGTTPGLPGTLNQPAASNSQSIVTSQQLQDYVNARNACSTGMQAQLCIDDLNRRFSMIDPQCRNSVSVAALDQCIQGSGRGG